MTDGELLAALPASSFAFVLVLSRVSAAVMLLPGFGEAEPPAMVRAGLALAIAALLFPAVLPLLPDLPDDPWRMGAMVGAELLCGVLLGWLARLIALALPVAGAIIATLIGLASVLQPDPAQGGQSTALARLFGIAMPVLVLSSGLYALPLQALAGSYATVPPGTLVPVGPATESVVAAVGECFALALRLAAPFVVAGLVFQAAAGMLARLVPQVQVYVLAAPASILGGVALLGVLAGAITESWAEAVRTAWSTLPGL